jgi:AraC-like DNA-binding protein/mannose-6-phosphate isomerase-like protein (cupin superfamily)
LGGGVEDRINGGCSMQLRNKRKNPHLHHFTALGIYVFESRHSENFDMKMDSWEFHKLCIIIKGSGFLETPSTRVEINEDQLLYIPPQIPHRFQDRKGDPLTLVMVCFYDHVFNNSVAQHVRSHFQQTFPMLFPYKLIDNYQRLKIMNSFKLMLFEQVRREEGYEARIWCQLVEDLVFLTRSYKGEQKVLSSDSRENAFKGCLYYIDNNFYKPIKIEELASLANMSYRRFTALFKQRTGITVTEYLSKVRIEYAKKLMLDTENILYAAIESGYGDLAHFYRVFKKTTGKTPRQFIIDSTVHSEYDQPRKKRAG